VDLMEEIVGDQHLMVTGDRWPSGVSIQGIVVLIHSGGGAGSGTAVDPKPPKAPKGPTKATDTIT
jgi:hypothetical protein